MKIFNTKRFLPIAVFVLPVANIVSGCAVNNINNKDTEKVEIDSSVMKNLSLIPKLTLSLADNPAQRILDIPKFPSPKILDGLETQADTNFVGGVTYRYTDKSIQKLKRRIMRPENLIQYQAPIENKRNVYSEPFGYYFAERPAGGNKKRPHLGLDIFATNYAVKPKEPVVIKSPIDGVVIAQKKARKKDNIIANMVTILGVDGRRYSFDHIARETDYKTSIPLPELGTIVRAGDEIGYIGRTGETTLWHLHLLVMTDEQLAKQKESKLWQNLSKNDYCPLRGQVNPLNREEAGPIADILAQYRGCKPNAIGNFKYK